MCPPPKPPKPNSPPPPIEAPEIELGDENKGADTRQRKRRGRQALRTGLAIPSTKSGLSVAQ
jgi:hypothetical protein